MEIALSIDLEIIRLQSSRMLDSLIRGVYNLIRLKIANSGIAYEANCFRAIAMRGEKHER